MPRRVWGKYTPEIRNMILEVLGEQEKKCMPMRVLTRELHARIKAKWPTWQPNASVKRKMISVALHALEWRGKLSIRPPSVVYEGIVYVMEMAYRLRQFGYFVARYDSPYFGHYHPAEVDYGYPVLEVDRGTWHQLRQLEGIRRRAARRRSLGELRGVYLAPAQPSVDESDQKTPIAADPTTNT